MIVDQARSQLEAAVKAAEANSATGLTQLKDVFSLDGSDPELIKVKEDAITEICKVLVREADAQGHKNLLDMLQSFYATVTKAKAAKIVRTILQSMALIPGTEALQINVCREQAEWARTEKRGFLRQRIQMRLSSLLIDTEEFKEAMSLVGALLIEFKKLDDKLLLVDMHLIESRLHHLLHNLPKSKAALTAARSAANAVYVPPSLQAQIDLMSGTINAEERDFKTAFSYFFEAFEQYNHLGSPKALASLKYMLLCKVMSGHASEVTAITNGRQALQYAGSELDAMALVAKARMESNLGLLREALDRYRAQLEGDTVVKRHLNDLNKSLLEQNLIQIIKPYSRVEVAHLAHLIKLDVAVVEKEVSQMILDKKISGILDQGSGCLEVFEEAPEDKAYPAAIEIMQHMGVVLDSLFARCQKLVV